MTKLNPISPKKLESILIKLGFEKTRQKGSHAFYRHPNGRYTTIPFHGNADIGPVLLNKIIKETGIKREDFE